MVEENDLHRAGATGAIDPRRAAALAALTPATILVLLFGDVTFGKFVFGFAFMLAPTLIAVPIFAALDRRGLANAVTAIGTGIAVGASLSYIAIFPGAEAVAAFGGLGALGGAAFWLALKLCGWWRLDDDPPEEPD